MLTDLRCSVRMLLLKSPGFTIVTILTLALGIGANTAIFSLVDAVLWRPLPVTEPDRLAALFVSNPDLVNFGVPVESVRYGWFSSPDYIYHRDYNQVFSDLAAQKLLSVDLSSRGNPERVTAALVSLNYFTTLGVKAIVGRTFSPEQDQTPNTHPMAVVSQRLWNRLSQSDVGFVGETVKLNRKHFTVIGVLPERFKDMSPERSPEVWVPLSMASQLTGEEEQEVALTGRLKPGITFKQAEAAMNVLARQLEQAHPDTNKGKFLTLLPASQAKIWPGSHGSIMPLMELLVAVVGLVLLIACANVANLLLARAMGRQREMGIRLALGAGRGRLIRQLLAENFLLAMMGAVLGVLLAISTSRLLLTFRLPTAIPLQLEPSFDLRIFGFTALLSILSVVLFGLAPSIGASKPDLVPALKEGTSAGSRSRSLLRSLLVVSQIALSLLLLIGAGLLIRSLRNQLAIDLGFRPGNVLLMSMDLERQGYTEPKGKMFYQELVQRLEARPGVKSVSSTMVVPFSDIRASAEVSIEGQHRQKDEIINFDVVGLKYFQTIGIPLLRGRDFSDRDRPGAPSVVIINETMARRYWPGQNPMGKRLSINGHQGPYLEVIAVAKDGKYYDLHEEPLPYMYLPLLQNYRPFVTLFVSTIGDPKRLVPEVRAEILALDPELPVSQVRTLQEGVDIWFSQTRTSALLLSLFGLVALLLTSVGLYGVISYSVSQRTREIGIRKALGAQQHEIRRLVVKQGMVLVLFGTATGLTGALALTRLMSSLLYGVSPTDPMTFAVIVLILTTVGLMASYLPARRATKVDPMVALRYE